MSFKTTFLKATSINIFTVKIIQNDNSPIFEQDTYNVTVMENLPVGFTVLQVTAFDSDKGENSEFKYVLKDESGAFQIDSSSGWISVKNPAKLDREINDRIVLKVTAVERKPNINPDLSEPKSCYVAITLLDSNDNNPVCSHLLMRMNFL